MKTQPPSHPDVLDTLVASPIKPNEVFETMTCFKVGALIIRVWRECAEFTMGPDEEVVSALMSVRDTANGAVVTKRFVEAMKPLKRISAIEILNKNSRDGGLYYPDWH